jgi:hypothetical protein
MRIGAHYIDSELMDPIFDLFLVIIEGEGEISHSNKLLGSNPVASNS